MMTAKLETQAFKQQILHITCAIMLEPQLVGTFEVFSYATLFTLQLHFTFHRVWFLS